MKHFAVGLIVVLVCRCLPAQGLGPALGVGNPSATGGGNSFYSSMSADARHVVFQSHANNLVTNDSLGSTMDLFLWDLLKGTTTLVSGDAEGKGGGNDDSYVSAVSANGGWVAFDSAASNLVAGDTNGFSDVFLRDVGGGMTARVSQGSHGTDANGPSGCPLISSNGNLVVYESSASNLVPLDHNGVRDIFVYDHSLRSNRVVSADANFSYPIPGIEGPAHSAATTPDARFVVYVKDLTNSALNPPAISHGEIYSRDMQSTAPLLLSDGVHSNFSGVIPFRCYAPAISSDGRFVVFKANNGSPAAALYRRDFQRVYPELVAADAAADGLAQMSSDGRFVAYDALDGIRFLDCLTASNRLVLGNIEGVTGCKGSQPTMSADGNRAVFLVASNKVTSVYVYDWSADRTSVAVVYPDGSPIDVNDSVGPLLSENGKTVVFDSLVASIVPDDLNHAYDVFAFDTEQNLATLVSARAGARPAVTPPVAGLRLPVSISANGRFAAISTFDWFNSDTNVFRDVYLRDLGSGNQVFLGGSMNGTFYSSMSADGKYAVYLSLGSFVPWIPIATGSLVRRDLTSVEEILIHVPIYWDAHLSSAVISPDGSQVAFVAEGIPPLFSSLVRNLYIVDLSDGTTNLVSAGEPSGPGAPPVDGDDSSMEPVFSPDGRWLFFRSQASNLGGTYAGGYSLYARDLRQNRTVLIAAPYSSFWEDQQTLAVSLDSRYVASVGYVQGLGSNPTERVTVFDLTTEVATLVTNALWTRSVSISGEGRWIAFDSAPSSSGPWNIWVRDTMGQTNELISMQFGTTEPAMRSSDHPLISHDGRYVVFASDATNLVAGDLNNAKDVFIRDRWRGVTMLASINRKGTGSGNGASLLPVLSADGRTLLFQSFASDLIEGDYNETSDVFVLRLGSRDEDGDGMDDEWEVAYFGTTTRDGVGDFDGDGVKDAGEFRLGTDPTNAGSVFQVLKLSREDGMGTKLLWSATPGRTYRVQFKDDVASGDWSEAPETVTAAGTSAVWTDDAMASKAERFYRVLLVP